MFTILIPTWNNLSFAQLCVESIGKNSAFQHQIVLHINDGSDGTLQWAIQNKITFTHSSENIGICKAVNQAAHHAIHDYIVFMNDDMFVLPDWDRLLLNQIQALSTDCFMLSSTMIEPYDTGNRCVVVADYGKSVTDFRRDQLMGDYKTLRRDDWSGSTWPPSVVHRKWWNKVGGYSEEFSPGMSSDDDFAMKMWQAGCRIYMGLGQSLVYHFISKSTGRVVKNDGRKQFLKKWGIKQSVFHRYYTHRGEPYSGILQGPQESLRFTIEKWVGRIFG